MPKCPHKYEPMARGSNRERCTICRDTYPCAHACGHLDCAMDTGRALPDHVTAYQDGKLYIPSVSQNTEVKS